MKKLLFGLLLLIGCSTPKFKQGDCVWVQFSDCKPVGEIVFCDQEHYCAIKFGTTTAVSPDWFIHKLPPSYCEK